jgi:hypothetical protein
MANIAGANRDGVIGNMNINAYYASATVIVSCQLYN